MYLLKIKTLVLLISIVLISFGCQDNPNSASEENKNIKTYRIALIAKSSSNPVFQNAKIGAEKAAKKISEDNKNFNVNIEWMTPENENFAEQAKFLSEAVADSIDAIIISASSKDSLTTAINYAVDRGIPVMTFDSDAPDSKRFAFYGPDNVEIGKILGNEMVSLIEESGKIGILGGSKEGPNLQLRIAGIKETVAKYPFIEIVEECYHPEDEKAAVEAMMKVQMENPDIKGWIMVGSWALFGNELQNKIEPGNMKIVAVDALPEQFEYIEKNYIQVLLGQPTFNWGKVSVETIIDKLTSDEEIDEVIRMKTIRVSIDNLGGWSRQLRAWGYKDIPEKYLVM